jgi:hypothetical protein
MNRMAFLVGAALFSSFAHAQAIVTLWDPAYVAVRPGASVQVMVIADIRPGYVVIANRARDANLHSLSLRFQPTAGVTIEAPRYPDAQDTRVDADQHHTLTHTGTLRIGVPVTVSRHAAPGELTLEGELRYQACTQQRCSATRTLPIKLVIDVLAAKQ